MTFEELKNVMPNCPNCGRHCPIDDLNCNRGKDMVEKILADEANPEDYLNRSHERDEHGEHGEHDHGRHEHVDHERGENEHDRHGEREHRGHGHGEHGHDGFRHGEFDEHEDHEGRRHGEFGENDECERGRRHEGRGFEGDPHRRHHRPMPPMPEDDSLMSLLFHAAHAVRPRMEDGPGMGQARVLKVLKEEGSVAQSVLQDKLAVRPGSLSELLGKLEAKGLIKRTPDPEDRRKNTLSLTEEGEKAVEDREERLEDRNKAFDMLSEEEQETLKGLLKKILEGRKF